MTRGLAHTCKDRWRQPGVSGWLPLLSHRAVALLGLPSFHPVPLPHLVVAASSHWAAGYPFHMLGHLRWAAAESYCQAAYCSCAQPLSLAPGSQPDVATPWPSPGLQALLRMLEEAALRVDSW